MHAIYFNFMTDIVFISYMAISLLSITGAVLFAWWWRRNHSATRIYAYFTILLCSEALFHLINLYYRIMFKIDQEKFISMLDATIWKLRTLPLAIVYALIIFHICNRIFKSWKGTSMLQTIYRKEDFTDDILVVEDNREVRDIIARMIKKQFKNVTVHAASRYREAVSIMDQFPSIKLVITDINLGGRTGFQLCSHIKEERPWIFVIGITGYQDHFELTDARNIGFDDYFIKPFRVGDLIDSVNNTLEKFQRWRSGSIDPCKTVHADNINYKNMDTLVGIRHEDQCDDDAKKQ